MTFDSPGGKGLGLGVHRGCQGHSPQSKGVPVSVAPATEPVPRQRSVEVIRYNRKETNVPLVKISEEEQTPHEAPETLGLLWQNVEGNKAA